MWAPQNSNLLYYILFQERVNRTWTVQNKIKETNPKPKKKAVTLFSVSLSLLQLSLQSLIFQNSFSQNTDRRTEQTRSLSHSKTLSFSTPLAVLDSLRRSFNNFWRTQNFSVVSISHFSLYFKSCFSFLFLETVFLSVFQFQVNFVAIVKYKKSVFLFSLSIFVISDPLDLGFWKNFITSFILYEEFEFDFMISGTKKKKKKNLLNQCARNWFQETRFQEFRIP